MHFRKVSLIIYFIGNGELNAKDALDLILFAHMGNELVGDI